MVTPPRSPYVCVDPPDLDGSGSPTPLLPPATSEASGGAYQPTAATAGSASAERFLFKVVDEASRESVRLHSLAELSSLQLAVLKTLGPLARATRPPTLAYVDRDGFKTPLTSDADLVDAVRAARRCGQDRLQLHAAFADARRLGPSRLLAASLVVAAGVAVALAVARARS